MKTAMDIPDKEGQKRLVIVGGGFDGLKLARKLNTSEALFNRTRYWTALNRPRVPVIRQFSGMGCVAVHPFDKYCGCKKPSFHLRRLDVELLYL